MLPGSAKCPSGKCSRRQLVAVEREHVEPVLPLQRDVDPRFRRMEIEMARAEPVSAIGRDRDFVGQQPVAIGEHFQRPRLLGVAAGGVMAAGDQDDQTVIEADPHLMAVDAGVERRRRRDLVPGVMSGLTRYTRRPLGLLKATSRCSDGMSLVRWIGRVGKAIGAPCGDNAPEAGSMRRAVT